MILTGIEKQQLLCTLSSGSTSNNVLGMSGNMSMQIQSQDKRKSPDIKQICITAALSHYITVSLAYIEFVKLHYLLLLIACMPGKEKNCDEDNSKGDTEEKELDCAKEASCEKKTEGKECRFEVGDIDLESVDDISSYDESDDLKTVDLSLTRDGVLCKVNTTNSLSRGIKDDLKKNSLFISSPINFMDGICCDNSLNNSVHGTAKLPLLSNDDGQVVSGNVRQHCIKIDKKYKTKPTGVDKWDDVSMSNESACNKPVTRSNDSVGSTCKDGASSFKKFVVVVLLLCSTLIGTVTGVPVLDKNKMVDKNGVVYHEFPLLIYKWCDNPENSNGTCIKNDQLMGFKMDYCHYNCPSGDVELCMKSELGLVYFCIPKDTSCAEGIGWHVEGIVDKYTQKYVIVRESSCPNGTYQSHPSECHNACKTEHEPPHLIPKGFKILSDGNNIHTTYLRCDHDIGFYNTDNKPYTSFDKKFVMGFCTHVSSKDPCKSGHMPLYNGTCVENCRPGFKRDEIDFLCKLNGTTGEVSTRKSTSTESEIQSGNGKGQDKDVGSGMTGQAEGNSQLLIILIIIGIILMICFVLIVVKVFCFPNKCVPPCEYGPVSVIGSELSSEVSTQDAEKGGESVNKGISMGSLQNSESSESSSLRTEEENNENLPVGEGSISESDLDETSLKKYIKRNEGEEAKALISPTAEDDDIDHDISAGDSDDDDETYLKTVMKKKSNPAKASSSTGKKTSGSKVKKMQKYKGNYFIKIESGVINLGTSFNQDGKEDLLRSICDQFQIPEDKLKKNIGEMNTIGSESKGKGIKKIEEEDMTQDENMLPAGAGDMTPADVEDMTPAGTGDVTHAGTGDVTPAGTGDVTQAGTGDVTPAGTGDVTQAGTGDVPPAGTGNVTPAERRNVRQEFASPINKTVTQILINVFGEFMKSVGALIYKGEHIGTVFRAGENYLITALHVVRRIIDPNNTYHADFSLMESEDVFINFNASLCGETGYIYRVRHVMSSNTKVLDYTVLQITNRNDALPKGLKLAKCPINIAQLYGIGYGDPEKPSDKVLDPCHVIPCIGTRIQECRKWLMPDDHGQMVTLHGRNATLERVPNRLESFRGALQEMGSNPDTVNKAYKDVDIEHNIFLDICLQHRGSGSPFLTNNGLVAGFLTHGHPDFFFLLPKQKQEGFPSDKRFECLLKLDHVYENILGRDSDLAQNLFG